MDFLFVNPVTFELSPGPQIGQLILHHVVRQKYDSTWINFDLLNKEKSFEYSTVMDDNIRRMAEYICNFNSKIIGLYTICNSFDITVELAMLIKQNQREISPKIVLGGPHASVLASKILRAFDFIDVICIGESEKTILPLTDALISNNDVVSLQHVPGIAYRNEYGEICQNINPPLLDAEELGKYTVFNYGDKFDVDIEQSLSIEGGRGCPFHCTFCSTSKFWGAKHRVKPIDMLIGEMDTYYELYGAHIFSVVHDHFTANRKYILEFCKKVKSRPYTWTCSSRADILNDELIDNLISAGCTRMYLGIETGSQRMQKELNKNLNIAKVKKVLMKLKQVGMHVTVSFIYCFPDETVFDFMQTIVLIEYCIFIGIDVLQLHKFCLYAGSAETEKVAPEMLYFDETDMRMTKSEKNAFSTQGIQLTRKFPELFIHNYTFQTEVTERYHDFDLLVLLVTLHNKKYKRTIECLFSRHSMVELYDQSLHILEKWARSVLKEDNRRTLEMFESDESKEILRASANLTLEKICSCDELAAFLFQYEYMCDKFVANEYEFALAELPFSLECALKEGTLIKERSYIKLSKGSNDDTVTVAQLTSNVYELLKRLGYKSMT